MTKKIINKYDPIMSLVPGIFSNICLSSKKHESMLYLKNPKLLYDIIEDSSNNLEIEIPNLLNASYNLKSEKKSKSNFKLSDTIEVKKSKIKQRKKIRSNIHLDKDFSDTVEDLELNRIRPLPFLRPPKSLKSKKNNKYKINESQGVEFNIVNTKTALPVNHSKQIYLGNLLTVQELAEKLNIPSAEIIKWLFLQGISVTINQSLDLSVSKLIAEHYSFTILQEKNTSNVLISGKHKQNKGETKAPVITLLGHVDHGKTTLLNAIRKVNRVDKEAGNITQVIGSYEVFLDDSQRTKKLIFLDTPGHEAFISIRKRGAEITDLVILVVSADDGLKPQTIEAIEHIKKRNLPFIVAINKIDKIEANIDKVKKQLLAFNVNDKDTGGSVPIIAVSATTGENIDLLLSTLLSLSETQNLKSDPSQLAEGIILEAYLDKKRGPVAKILLQNGTLYIGSMMVTGGSYGKVKAITDSNHCKAGSIRSTALAEVLGFPSIPKIGLPFEAVQDEKTAKSQASSYNGIKTIPNSLNTRIVLDSMNIDGSKCVVKKVNIIIKTDVQGSIDPIINAFSKIPQEKVQINILSASSGEISSKDLQLASTSNSIILAFNINVTSTIVSNAENASIIVRQFNVIYDLVDYVKSYMLTLVEIEYTKEVLGHAEVRNLFFINKGVVAGCFVLDGKLKRNEYISITRNNQVVYDGLLNSLRKVKEDVEEVFAGNDCGLMCKEYNLWQVSDGIEAYILRPMQKTL